MSKLAKCPVCGMKPYVDQSINSHSIRCNGSESISFTHDVYVWGRTRKEAEARWHKVAGDSK